MTKSTAKSRGPRTSRPPPAAKPREVNSVAAIEGALVLVVDDFPDNREMYAEFLNFAGFRTVQAANGMEALEQAFAHQPDIILMDLSLPGMDGWEATRRLKADERTRDVPVVALTGHALAGHSQGAKDAGCDAFIAKPCLPDDLVTQVKALLAQSSAPKKGRR